MGIDQLGFQSVQLGYLKILQMGNIDPNNTKAGKEYEVKPHMGIDQLGFQSVQLGYLKILQMGNIDPNNTKAGKEYEVKPQLGLCFLGLIRMFKQDFVEVLKEMADRTIKRAKGLPTDGLTDLSEVPNHLVMQARTVFSRLDTHQRRQTLTLPRTKQSMLVETDEPKVAKVAIVKRKPVSKKKSASTVDKDADVAHVGVLAEKAMSKKRPAAVFEAPVVKKKRTTSGKAVSKEKDLAIVSVALDVVPIQTVDPTSAMPAAHPSAPKRKAPKRKLRMTAGSDDEFVEKESAVETFVVEQKATTSIDDVDTTFGEVIAATEQLETDVVESDSDEDLAIRTDLEEPVEPRSDDIPVEVAEHSTVVTNEEDLETFRKVLETSVSPISDDESLSIEEHLARIPEGMMLPSLTSAEPTKIKFCNEIEIRGVADGDWYKENLPKIAATDKGKKYLGELDTVQGHPAREQFQLICGDIDFLILLREKVITDMTSFFHSFSLRNLKAMRSVRDILTKEEKMLAWAETDSLETAIQRQLLIIAKYREVLLRKFLEARCTNLVPGLPTTTIDQRTLDLLSEAHQQAVRNLLRQMRAHGLKWTRPVSSMLFEEPNLERGFFIPRTHKTIFSTCWIRILRKIEGSWVVEEGYDRLVCQYKVLTHSGLLLRLGVGLRFGQISFVILYSVLPDFSVQISPVVYITSVPTASALLSPRISDISLPSPHQSSSSASTMHFTDDILQDAENAVEHLEPVTATATDINEKFAQLRTSISEISIKQLRKQSRIGDLQNAILSKIDTRKKAAAEVCIEQDQSFRGIIKSLRQGVQTDTAALSVEMHEFKKAVHAQNAFITTDLADLRKEVKDLKAELSKDFDDKLAVIRNDLLEFRVETRGQLASLGTNLAELIAFVTKGRDEKKGKLISSHGREQPPRGDGGSGGSRSEPSKKRGSSGSRQKSWRYWLNE
ncbi:hypothetical protein F511_38990 [Dorcoceras hygrometricum]|uniref:Uncharacterized protein n=1 Tax=Dorcoceras hygrometricum TaxID=472368 RepID=A0A2Z7B6Y0_9LAMI|nr:hypothetical protein F511_38990 [Dorcoceras hygrometricum]